MAKRRAPGEGTLYYDATRARWVGQAWVAGRRRKVSAATKIDASAKLGRLVHDRDDHHVDRRLTVARLLDDWQRTALPDRRLSESTRIRHGWIARHLTAELGRSLVANLDAETVERALERLAAGSQGRPMSRSTLTKVRNTLGQALDWAQRRRLVTWNAARAADLPPAGADGHPKRALDRDELNRLFEALEGHRLRGMFAAMALAGLRPGEAAGLCVDAVDVEAWTLSVVRSVRLERGSARLVDETKTAGSRRTLRISPKLVEMLSPVVEGRTGLLWPQDDGVTPLRPSTGRDALRAACARAGLEPLSSNELRHTFATLAVEAGMMPHTLADILGHRGTQMVERYYRHRPAIIRGADALDVLGAD